MEQDNMTRSIKKAIFPVGGLGKRFYPATLATPKEMLPVVDRPLIDYALEEARLSGIEEFIFITRKGKSSIEDYVEEYFKNKVLEYKDNNLDEESGLKNLTFSFTRQSDSLGLGHAIWCARHLVGDDPFAVILPDELFCSKTPCLLQLIRVYEERGGCVIGLGEIPIEKSYKYGIVSYSEDDGKVVKIDRMIEKPLPQDAPSNLSIIGRYIIQPQIFGLLGQEKSSIGGEIQLTNSLSDLIEDMNLYGLRCKGQRFDCGSKPGLIEANISLAMDREDLRDEIANILRDFNSRI